MNKLSLDYIQDKHVRISRNLDRTKVDEDKLDHKGVAKLEMSDELARFLVDKKHNVTINGDTVNIKMDVYVLTFAELHEFSQLANRDI